MARDLSSRWKSMRVAVALAALVTLGCGSGGDPKPIDIRDFTEARPVNDSLKKLVPVGTPVPQAQALMEQSGFKCNPQVRSAITVDVVTGKLGSGPPTLECWNSNRISLGLQHRDWHVVYRYDSAGVRDVVAGYIIQP